MKRLFTMIVEAARDRNGRYYGASFPELPGCYTMGDTLRHLRANAKEAIRLHLEGLQQTGQSVPTSLVRVDAVEVTLPIHSKQKRSGKRAVAAQQNATVRVIAEAHSRRSRRA